MASKKSVKPTPRTPRQRVEKLSGESPEIFGVLFENNPIPMWFYDRGSLAFLEVNQAAVQKYGYSRLDFRKMTVEDLLPEEEVTDSTSGGKWNPAAPQPAGEVQHRLKNGRVIDVEVKSRALKLNGRDAVFVIAADVTAPKRAKEALAASEAELRSLFASMGDVVLVIDRLGVYREIAPTKPGLLYEPSDELLGKNLRDVFPVEQAEALLGTVNHVLSTRQTAQVEYELPIGGQTLWFSTSIAPMDAERTLWVARDITERKQAEYRLTAERNLLRTLIDHLPDNIFVKDLDGRVVVDNVAHRHLLGASTLEEVVGKTDFDFFARSLAASYDDDEKEIIHLGKALINREEPTVDRDGKQRWLLTTKLPWRDHQGKIAGIVGINRDITDRRRVEDALRQSEEHFHSLFDSATVGMYRTTPDGRILLSNPAAVHMLGFGSFEEMAKRNLEQDGFDADHPRSEFRERLQNEGTVIGLERTWKRADGATIFVRESATAVRDTKGNVLYYDGTFEDITQRKQAQTLQEAVYRIAAAAETAGSLDDLYQDIHQIISSVMPAENFFITIYDAAQDLLRFPYFKDVQDEPFIGGIQPGKGLTAYILRTGKSLLCTQAMHDELERRGEVRLLGVPSAIWLGVPLIADGKTIGAMVVQHYSDPEAYGEREQHMLEFVSTQVALAIDRKQAQDELRRAKEALEIANGELQQSLAREESLARTDGLTGLCNRFHFDELSAREFQAAVRYQRALSIIMFDIDDFKLINDSLGHAAGDRVLALIAQAAAECTRGADVLARFGGDEFILMLPETTAQQALPIAERIRLRVAAIPIRYSKHSAAITLSIGISELQREPMDGSVEQVVGRADKALYQAKGEGGNCTVIFDPGRENESAGRKLPDKSPT